MTKYAAILTCSLALSFAARAGDANIPNVPASKTNSVSYGTPNTTVRANTYVKPNTYVRANTCVKPNACVKPNTYTYTKPYTTSYTKPNTEVSTKPINTKPTNKSEKVVSN